MSSRTWSTFPNLGLALEAMANGGNAPCVLNAANEVAVEAVPEGAHRIPGNERYGRGPARHRTTIDSPTLNELEASDAETRRLAT